MKKILIIVLGVLVMLAGVIYFINTGEKRATEKATKENPLFHTVVEGGVCIEGRGDCEVGLTCSGGTCQKP